MRNASLSEEIGPGWAGTARQASGSDLGRPRLSRTPLTKRPLSSVEYRVGQAHGLGDDGAGGDVRAGGRVVAGGPQEAQRSRAGMRSISQLRAWAVIRASSSSLGLPHPAHQLHRELVGLLEGQRGQHGAGALTSSSRVS